MQKWLFRVVLVASVVGLVTVACASRPAAPARVPLTPEQIQRLEDLFDPDPWPAPIEA